jgi:hypothetical protein
MKNTLILSEAIIESKIKQVNQGAFINITDVVNDIFSCFNIPCCENQADFFIRKAYLLKGRKKPGANWTSLNKIVMDIYNCEFTETFCPGLRSEQWWITTDVIRPRKTIETISFTGVIKKVFECCNLLTNIVTQNSNCLLSQNGQYIVTQ